MIRYFATVFHNSIQSGPCHRQSKLKRQRRLGQFTRPVFGGEQLEQRTLLAADFSQFQNLAQALTDLQNNGVTQQIFDTSLPFLGNAVTQGVRR